MKSIIHLFVAFWVLSAGVCPARADGPADPNAILRAGIIALYQQAPNDRARFYLEYPVLGHLTDPDTLYGPKSLGDVLAQPLGFDEAEQRARLQAIQTDPLVLDYLAPNYPDGPFGKPHDFTVSTVDSAKYGTKIGRLGDPEQLSSARASLGVAGPFVLKGFREKGTRTLETLFGLACVENLAKHCASYRYFEVTPGAFGLPDTGTWSGNAFPARRLKRVHRRVANALGRDWPWTEGILPDGNFLKEMEVLSLGFAHHPLGVVDTAGWLLLDAVTLPYQLSAFLYFFGRSVIGSPVKTHQLKNLSSSSVIFVNYELLDELEAATVAATK